MKKTLFFLTVWVPLLVGCADVIRAGNPLWRVPIVSKEHCGSIDGRYWDRGSLASELKDSSTRVHVPKFSISEGFFPKPYIGLPSAEFYAAQRRFNETALVDIKKTYKGWVISLYGGDGKEYERTTIFPIHENVGCDSSGRLVLRKFSVFSGSEGTGGSASAAEIVISRSNDGGLELLRWDRIWNKSMEVPPTRESSQIMRFPVAP